MLKSYLIIAWRTITRHKLFSFINIFGLSLSIALGTIILQHVVDIMRYESFNPNLHKVYRINSLLQSPEGGKWTMASSPLPLKELLKNQVAIQKVTRVYPSLTKEALANDKLISVSTAFTDTDFFDVLGFTLRYGNVPKALVNPNSVVLSAETAEKFFRTIDPVGKTMALEGLGTFQITGVLNQTKSKSHIHFDVLLSDSIIPSLERDHKIASLSEDWNSYQSAYTYILVDSQSNDSQLTTVLTTLSGTLNKDTSKGSFTLQQQRLSSITPGSDEILNETGSPTTWGKLLAEIAVGIVILLAACFNYTNLTLARAFTRTKEIGLRRISGARKRQLFVQHIIESVVISFMALFFSQVVISVLDELQLFDVPRQQMDVVSAGLVIAFAAIVGVFAGIIPAFPLSSFNAIRMMRNISSERLLGAISLRKALVVFQFGISLMVLIFTSAFNDQFSYMESIDPGFRMRNVVSARIDAKDYHALKSQLGRLAGVDAVGGSSGNFGRYATGRTAISADEKPEIDINYFFIDSDIINVSDLKIIAGRNFHDNESAEENEIIINEEASKVLRFKHPGDAIGQQVMIQDTILVTIAGVVKNFYYEGVGIQYRPLMLRHAANQYNFITVLTNSNASREIEQRIKSVYDKISPDRPFEPVWLLEQHQSRYDQMGSVSTLGFLAFMAISIASLGLLGLVVYTVETRRKEISIRKIIGASVNHLTYLISKGFVSLLLIAGAIASPIAWAGSQFFLMNFANRISFGLLQPLLCFLGLLAIGLITILTQTVRVSFENPVKNLKE